jgi:hypothetical protein
MSCGVENDPVTREVTSSSPNAADQMRRVGERCERTKPSQINEMGSRQRDVDHLLRCVGLSVSGANESRALGTTDSAKW